jgi:hypothetical protein
MQRVVQVLLPEPQVDPRPCRVLAAVDGGELTEKAGLAEPAGGDQLGRRTRLDGEPHPAQVLLATQQGRELVSGRSGRPAAEQLRRHPLEGDALESAADVGQDLDPEAAVHDAVHELASLPRSS